MPKGYVVSEVGYEYNDEIYSCGENCGVHPLKIYLNEEKARSEVVNKNLNEKLSINITEYGYEWDDFLDDFDEFKKLLENYFQIKENKMNEFGKWWQANARNLPEELKKSLCDLINIHLYELREVEIDV